MLCTPRPFVELIMAKQNELSVPLGLNESGILVKAAHADKLSTYRCPSCESQLILRVGKTVLKSGKKIVTHFAHQKSSECSQESIEHKTAKKLIVQAISSGYPIYLMTRCIGGKCRSKNVRIEVSKVLLRAEEEVSVDQYRVDVLGYDGKGPRVAIEIKHTHKVDDEKGGSLNIPWIELSSEDVLKDPYHWVPLQSSFENTTLCRTCRQFREAAAYWIGRVGSENTPYYPAIGYTNDEAVNNAFRVSICQCIHCDRVIPYFGWQYDSPPDIKTLPKTVKVELIKKGWSSHMRHYFYEDTCRILNYCLHCGSKVMINEKTRKPTTFSLPHMKYRMPLPNNRSTGPSPLST